MAEKDLKTLNNLYKSLINFEYILMTVLFLLYTHLFEGDNLKQCFSSLQIQTLRISRDHKYLVHSHICLGLKDRPQYCQILPIGIMHKIGRTQGFIVLAYCILTEYNLSIYSCRINEFSINH